MSYCRFGPESDLYVIGRLDGYECLNCKIMPGEYTSWHGKTRTELFNHLMDHKDRGDKVPFSAIHRIGMELANIPEEHWNQELVILMNKLSSSNGTLKQFLDMYRVNHRKQVKHLLEELFAVIANLDDLDWPEDDD